MVFGRASGIGSSSARSYIGPKYGLFLLWLSRLYFCYGKTSKTPLKKEIGRFTKFRIMLSFGLVAALRQEVAQAEALAEALLS